MCHHHSQTGVVLEAEPTLGDELSEGKSTNGSDSKLNPPIPAPPQAIPTTS